jgi:hypothetical protein
METNRRFAEEDGGHPAREAGTRMKRASPEAATSDEPEPSGVPHMSAENRRSKRRAVESVVQVTDAMTGAPMGRIGNLSIDGLMMISTVPVQEDALYQVAFPFPPGPGAAQRTIEVGIHEQWTEAATMPGHYWAGFRIIDIAPADRVALKAWIDGG